jgi:hypothetical protein
MERRIIVNLVFLFMMTQPKVTFAELFLGWQRHKVLKDYQRPDHDTLKRIWRVCRQVIKEEYEQK